MMNTTGSTRASVEVLLSGSLGGPAGEAGVGSRSVETPGRPAGVKLQLFTPARMAL